MPDLVTNALMEAGLVDQAAVDFPCGDAREVNWLVRLRELWQLSERLPGRRAVAGRRLAALQRLAPTAQLRLGTPSSLRLLGIAWEPWLGWRFGWWPDGFLPPKLAVTHGFVASRLGRTLEKYTPWFGFIRRYCQRLDQERNAIVVAEKSSLAAVTRRCAENCGLTTLNVEIHSRWSSWGRRFWTAANPMASDPSLPANSRRRLILSPPVEASPWLEHLPGDSLPPVQDRCLQAVACRLVVGPTQRQGNTARSLALLHDVPAVDSPQRIIAPPQTRTAVPLDLPLQIRSSPNAEGHGRVEHISRQCFSEPRLQHWTRRCVGPWPHQADNAFWDDLLFAAPSACHSPLAALARIIDQRTLLGGNRTVAGIDSVVSFTATPLAKLPSLRQYRHHRGRWDFEPYGVSIRQDLLEQRGALPVEYKDDTNSNDGCFVQRRSSAGIDWTTEREWRILGDVDLSRFKDDELVVFVPTRQEAVCLARLSPWPLVYFEIESIS